MQSPVVTEIEHDSNSPPVGSPGYYVQSPDGGQSVDKPKDTDTSVDVQMEEVVNVQGVTRNQQHKQCDVME